MSVCEFCKAIFSYSGDDHSSSGTLRPFSGSLQDANRGESLCHLCDLFARDIKHFFYYLFKYKPPEECRYIFKHKRMRDGHQWCEFLAIGVMFSIYDIPEKERTNQMNRYHSVADAWWRRMKFDDIRVDPNHTVFVLRYRSFTTDESNPLAKGISGRLISKDAKSNSALTQMVTLAGRHDPTCNCLSVNSNNHSHPKFPTRVLDIGSGADHGTIRLIEGRDRRGHYAALSHCWGLTRFVTTTRNLPDRLQTINVSGLPQTFQDAILVARRLGLRYLWIDSLCIIQADPLNSEDGNQAAKEDFGIESSMMSEYYGNSYITIAGDCSSSDSDGFLRRREADKSRVLYKGDAKEFLCEVKGKLSRLYLQRPVRPFTSPHIDEPPDPLRMECLQSRAWTLQERLLPNRVLHFGSDQNYLEDHEARQTKFEDGKISTYSTSWKTLYMKDAQSPFVQWYRAIEQFKTRKITNPSDTFPALSGLAQKISALSRDQYCAGIWRSDLARGILWETLDHVAMSPACTAPSWSWASSPRTLIFPTAGFSLGSQEREPSSYICANFLDCQTVPSTLDPFGEPRSGYIDLIAPVAMAKTVPGCHELLLDAKDIDVLSIYLSVGQLEHQAHAYLDQYGSSTGTHIAETISRRLYCAFIASFWDKPLNHCYGLILDDAGLQNDKKLYRRVGLFTLNEDTFHVSQKATTDLKRPTRRHTHLSAYEKDIRII